MKGGGAGEGNVMRKRWLGLFLGILLLATAPGCRVIVAAAALVGEAALDAALEDAFDHDDKDDARRHDRRSTARRAPAAPHDPCR